ncbi:MAG TPA: insulinase family protein, partial [Pyrinomonadaceae bacterium]|nr:insulinase family protein [Pyrinomonadaceae bacterium]
MRERFFTGKIAFIGLLAILLAATSYAQQPRKESLLNGLKVLVFPDNGSDRVWARIRVHSGSAFDPQGHEGVMKMLSGNIFPNEAAKDYFTDDLGGSLEVRTTYDYIEIDASAKPENLIPMLETLSGAIAAPVIDKDTTTRLREDLLAQLKQLERDPAYIADRTAEARLFGTFPYGRPINGTEGSLKKVDFA